MSKVIEVGAVAREKLVNGINKLSNAVTSTLGPNGRNVIFNDGETVVSTKDGVSVARRVDSFEDPIEELGAQMIKQASIKTADKAGDGTTTSTLLAQKIIQKGIKYLNNGHNAVEIKRGIDAGVKQIVECLKTQVSSDISSEEQLEQVAIISSNNDVETGKIIATALEKVGREGIVHIEESRSGETYLETVEGMQFDRGYKSHYFVTDNNNMSCTLDKPLVLIVDRKITQVKELLPLLENVSAQNRSLLIVAEDIDGEALATLIVNKARGILRVAAVKAPDFGERRKLLLEDMAILTGGTVFSNEKGMKFERFDSNWFGEARVVTLDRDKTTIVDGKGSEEVISKRIEELQYQIEKSTTPYEQEKLQERLSKFIGGVAIIHVGGNTEAEMREKKDRVDDALHAAKAAIEEGIVPGGGSALLYASQAIIQDKSDGEDFNIGKQIVFESCFSPFNKILSNAGVSDREQYEIHTHILGLGEGGEKPYFGYNIKDDTIINMVEKGIIDPTKVTRTALENAASVAGTVLLTECVIVEKKEESKNNSKISQYNDMF
jgi:chaperonin GroEL